MPEIMIEPELYEDFQVLHRRIRQQYGQQPVMITLVEETAEPGLTRHGFMMA